jgi:hypothetical protein
MGFLDEIAKRKIEEAIESGEWDNLPNKGQKLNLDEDPYTPEHLRLGQKLLRDAKVLPEWMQQRQDASHFLTRLQRQWQTLERHGTALRQKWLQTGSREARAKYLQWRERARRDWQDALTKANNEILTANLKAPPVYRTVAPLRIGEELSRFDEIFPD